MSYSFYRTITIDYTKVGGSSQTDFPVLLSGIYPFLASTSDGGKINNFVIQPSGVPIVVPIDLIITSDSAGLNLLKWEFETYSTSSGEINLWVKIPSISNSSDTVIYMFYGNPSAASWLGDSQDVWDSNFKGVWHLPDGDVLSTYDSTINNSNGSISGASGVPGQIDGAATMDGDTNFISFGPDPGAADNVTFSFWLYIISLNGTFQGIIGKRAGNALNSNFGLNISSTFNIAQIYYGTGSGVSAFAIDLDSSLPTGIWNHVYCTYMKSGSNTDVTFYVNGNIISGPNTLSGNVISNSEDLYIGRSFNSGEYANINVDEFRISSNVRSSDWILTEYNNQSSPSTFYMVGSENIIPPSSSRFLNFFDL
jgi:hypothetical protein